MPQTCSKVLGDFPESYLCLTLPLPCLAFLTPLGVFQKIPLPSQLDQVHMSPCLSEALLLGDPDRDLFPLHC